MIVRAAIAAALLSALSAAQARADVIILVTHEVKDFDAWKKGYDSDKPNRDKQGMKELFLSREINRPNVVHIGFRGPSVEKAKFFTDNPKLAEAMKQAGVIGAPLITVTNLFVPGAKPKSPGGVKKGGAEKPEAAKQN